MKLKYELKTAIIIVFMAGPFIDVFFLRTITLFTYTVIKKIDVVRIRRQQARKDEINANKAVNMFENKNENMTEEKNMFGVNFGSFNNTNA
jgi:hypothetical protein